MGIAAAGGGGTGSPDQGGVGVVPHALDAARHMPQDAQRDQSDERGDEAVLREVRPLIFFPYETQDCLKHGLETLRTL